MSCHRCNAHAHRVGTYTTPSGKRWAVMLCDQCRFGYQTTPMAPGDVRRSKRTYPRWMIPEREYKP